MFGSSHHGDKINKIKMGGILGQIGFFNKFPKEDLERVFINGKQM